jgi:hypothetical protein
MNDQLQQSTCEAIVSTAASVVDSEPASLAKALKTPDGTTVGKQITIDATEADGLLNMCRISVLNPDLAPEGEIVRIEFEHEKETKFDIQMTYSIQSVRRRSGQLLLLENFLSDSPELVREDDFRPIRLESYARQSVLGTLQDWSRFRAWQLHSAGKK